MPATTCALVIIKSGPTTNPEPVNRVLHSIAVPSTFTTESNALAIAGSAVVAAFGGSTGGANSTSLMLLGRSELET